MRQVLRLDLLAAGERLLGISFEVVPVFGRNLGGAQFKFALAFSRRGALPSSIP
jgi:hypothetical protein